MSLRIRDELTAELQALAHFWLREGEGEAAEQAFRIVSWLDRAADRDVVAESPRMALLIAQAKLTIATAGQA